MAEEPSRGKVSRSNEKDRIDTSYFPRRKGLDDVLYFTGVVLLLLRVVLLFFLASVTLLYFFGGRIGFYIAHNFSWLSSIPISPYNKESFFYGSIGNEAAEGIPSAIWNVLPDVCPPPGSNLVGREALYNYFGLFWEKEKWDRPIGFSSRKVSLLGILWEDKRISINCALCHTATYRLDSDPTTRIAVPGGPAHQLAAQEGLNFLIECISEKVKDRLQLLDRFTLVPIARQAMLERKEQFAFMETQPPWGHGRFEAINGVKIRLLKMPYDKSFGVVDIPAIWKLNPDHARNWDGNHLGLTDAIWTEALTTGVPRKTMDIVAERKELNALKDYLSGLTPPEFPLKWLPDLVAKGKLIYDKDCAPCHEKNEVIPLEEVGTDSYRLRSWTQEAADKKNQVGGFSWHLSGARKTNGYVAVPLDGIWLRAPYLHNGSVPTLRDLLEPPEQRPREFYRGYDVLDPDKVGFISNVSEECLIDNVLVRKFTLFNTLEPGNGNGGHLYGTQLTPDEKDALVEYLKTR